jgi:hypothetical protein
LKKKENVIKRRNNLREKQMLEKKYPNSECIYLDETFIHKNLTNNKIILCDNQLTDLKLLIGKGLRFSILHAGSVNGFIKNAELILVDKELKAESFEKWLTEQLLPNLPKNSIIVLDNASTHSRQYSRIPTQANNKKFTIDWLTENNIPYPENALKIELLGLVKKKIYGKNIIQSIKL